MKAPAQQNGGAPWPAPLAFGGGPGPALRLAVDESATGLRAVDASYLHMLARLCLIMAAAGALMIPLLGGDAVAMRMHLVASVVSAMSLAWLVHLTRRSDRRGKALVGPLIQVVSLTGHVVVYYFGVFSAFTAAAALWLYMVSQAGSPQRARWVYLNVAAGHGLLGVLIASGLLRDRGLVRADDLAMHQQLGVLAAMQTLFLLSFLLSRMSRARTLRAIRELEAATWELARRQDLLHEAGLTLAQAEREGPGRYTDQVVGSFRLGAVIGRGAMGEVYDAIHVNTGMPAAVKLLHGCSVDSAWERSRLMREAQVAAALSAPNLVRVYEVAAEHAGVPYLAMERLVGQDLGHILRERRALPLDAVLALVEQVSAALEVARDAGIVHRDLKPQNLFLDRSGRGPVWKVLDFGVSKMCSEPSSFTHGHLVGTPAYMAPEQARGHAVDHRADLYSLAVIAYRCLTGRPAFSGQKLPQVLYQVVHRMPARPSKLVALPADVDAVLAIAMAKRPKNRFASARELSRALAAASRGELPADMRERAEALLQRHTWNAER